MNNFSKSKKTLPASHTDASSKGCGIFLNFQNILSRDKNNPERLKESVLYKHKGLQMTNAYHNILNTQIQP